MTPPIVAEVTVKVIPVPVEVLPPIVPDSVEVIIAFPADGTVCVIRISNVVPAMLTGAQAVPPPTQLTTISPKLVLLGELTDDDTMF